MYIAIAIILVLAVGIFLYSHSKKKSSEILKTEKYEKQLEKIPEKQHQVQPINHPNIRSPQNNIKSEVQKPKTSSNPDNNFDREIPINKITIDDKAQIAGNDGFYFGKHKEIKMEIILADEDN